MSTTLPPLRPRGTFSADALTTPLAALDESRAGVAKAWLLHVVDAAPLDQIERIPVARIAAELPTLIAEMAAAAADGTAAAERAAWLDRLAGLRGDDPAAPLARELGALPAAMLGSLERQAAAFGGAELIAAAGRLATLFADLQADAAERATRVEGSLDQILAGADRLTGLHGQGFLREHLGHLVAMQKRYDQPFALLLVDVEGLKRINDAFGSRAGDDSLVGVAGAVERTIRTADTTVRMDEDEFCILLPNQTAGRARTAAERLAEAVEQVRDPAGVPLKISIGVVACPQHAATADDLLAKADGALYRAKASGERVAIGDEAEEE